MESGGGDIVALHNEEENPENWYLQNLGKSSKKVVGYQLREKKDASNSISFNSTGLVKLIMESVAFDGDSGRLSVGEMITVKGVGDMWTLITVGLRN